MAQRKSLKRIKDKIEDQLIALPMVVGNPDKKSNVGPLLYDIFVWQTAEKFVKDKLKKAYEIAQPDPVPNDDSLRAMGEGDFIVVESPAFSFTIKVSAPRESLDMELFYEELAKKYKLKVSDLKQLAEKCKTPGKRVLTKRVLEA